MTTQSHMHQQTNTSKFVYFAQLLLLFIAYFFTGKLGLTLDAVSGFATLFWIPTGISLAALLIGGSRLWPAIFLGAFFVNLTTGAPLLVALAIGIGNTLEALIAFAILARLINFRPSLERTHDLFSLTLIAAPIGAFVSASIGVSSLILGDIIPSDALSPTWIAWWIGNVLSDFIVAPFLLAWSTHRSFTKPSLKRIIEGIFLIAFFIFCSVIVFTDFLGMWDKSSPITYLIFPPLIWTALRFGQRETTTAILGISLFAVVSTISGIGPFVRDSISKSLFYLETFMGTVALTIMTLSVVMNEHKQLEKRKDEFISIASHELKTPITSMTIFLQLLKRLHKSKKDQKSLELIDKTGKQMKKMTKLISDLLDLSKIQVGKLELRKEKVSIYDVVHDVVDSMQRIAKKHKIIIEGETKRKVFADKERLGQVLINLLNNAIKYSPNAEKIVVSVKTTSQEAIISVQDFGIGIAKKDQEKIFERFFRVKGSNEKTYPGFGLGLYVASEIIRRHRGHVWVRSIKGKGSIFSFSLPLAKK